MNEKMIINSDDSELLVAFEQGKTVENTARIVGKDPSGVSRQLLRVSRACPTALEKKNGKWALTDTGRRLNSATREFIKLQSQIAERRAVLRLGANREFGARVLGNYCKTLSNLLPENHITISTFETGTENALIEGRVDIGFDCEKPIDPSIGFKHVISDPIIAVASPLFQKKYKKNISSKKFEELPHLLCDRLFPHRISQDMNRVNTAFSFNDIATTRAACIDNCGWALMPRYAVKQELENKTLLQLDPKPWLSTKYGIWWHRERFADKAAVKTLSSWLKSVEL